MWGDSQWLPKGNVTLTEDLHSQNILISFDVSMSMRELRERELAFRKYGDPAQPYSEHGVATDLHGEKIRIYESHPIEILREGDLLSFAKLRIKLADFGKGLMYTAP